MKFKATVRYGLLQDSELFTSNVFGLEKNKHVIIETRSGTEIGQIVSKVTPATAEDNKKSSGKIVRLASRDDLQRAEEIENEYQPEERKYCLELIRKLKLDMKLPAVEHLFGGEKIVFYFLSKGRVDFRTLVRELAKKYKTRIEMKQIGVRDEARLLGICEHCGRVLCCKRFIKDLEPVTMKMAKIQKTTLDPSKISGRCGRLMCCLRFEDELYRSFKRDLPQRGKWVESKEASGEVLGQDILNKTVTVETQNGRIVKVHVSDITKISDQGGSEDDKNNKDKRSRNQGKRSKNRDSGKSKTSQNKKTKGKNSAGKKPEGGKKDQKN